MSRLHIKPIFGGALLGSTDAFKSEAATLEVYDRLEADGCTTIDTLHVIPDNEAWIGRTGGGRRFTIDSKTPGGIKPGESTREGIVQHAQELAGHVGKGNVDIYNLHAPDPTIPLSDQLAGMNDAHKLGLFKRFGLSNFTAAQVNEVYNHCKSNNYVLPTAYQGNYNPVARRPEKELFPTLRDLGISFYAYSALAGGFLTKTPQQIQERSSDAGRFTGDGLASQMYRALYDKPSYLQALEAWKNVADKAGISSAELAYRWVGCDSALKNEYGDGVIFGPNKMDQVSDILRWLKKGPLGKDICGQVDRVWEMVKEDAPLDNYQDFFQFVWKDKPVSTSDVLK